MTTDYIEPQTHLWVERSGSLARGPEKIANGNVRLAKNHLSPLQREAKSIKSQLEAAKKGKPSKYRNVKTEVDGMLFDSKREAARYGELKLLEQAGEIRALATQPSYDLFVEGTRICRYKADFVYIDCKTSKSVTEDCKGVRTPVYRLKKKMMLVILGIDILET